MAKKELNDYVWAHLSPHFSGKKTDPGRSGDNNRLFVEAVLWLARSGAHWRALPAEFGKWNLASGIWQVEFCLSAV